MTEKVIKRGYVKWTDEAGVFHKELLVDHPELLAKADPADQLQAEEARRLNAAAEEHILLTEVAQEDDIEDTLVALKAAPEEVLTAAQLTTNADGEIVPFEAPVSGAEENGEKSEAVESLQKPAAEPIIHPKDEHEEALANLYKSSTED